MVSCIAEYDVETLDRLHQAELKIILAIDRVCRENRITYFLDSGTALGAARHNGFIPWDDDVDIGMLRPDFDRFMSIAQDALGSDFVVSSPRTNESQAPLTGKIWLAGTVFETQETKDAGLKMGIFADIFPYDVLNLDSRVADRQIAMGNRWQKISYLFHSPHVGLSMSGFKKVVARAACMIAHGALRLSISQATIIKHFDKAKRLGQENPSTDYVGLSYPMPDSYSEDMLLPTQLVRFEGYELPIPHDIDAYLTNTYGPTWRELPPVEKRKSHLPLILDFGDGEIVVRAQTR